MAKKDRQNRPPRRMSKQPESPQTHPDPGAQATKGEEARTVSESVATDLEPPPSPPPLPVSSPGGALLDTEAALPAEEETAPAAPEELELLTFHLADEEYAVQIAMIQEITKLADMTRIPRIPSYVKGIITLRGNVIPVFDMRARLGLPPFVSGTKSRFIICAAEEGAAAMLVDRVNDVVRLEKHRLEATPAGVAARDAGFIKNIARVGERLLILLDIEKTLRIDQ